jgi:hypothetical protein
MYWSENWKEQPTPTPSTNAAGSPSAKSGNDELLDKIINKNDESAPAGRAVRVKFPTPAFESRFKSCLAQVPVAARIEGEGGRRALLLRPQNVRQFEDLVRTSGLANCDAAIKAVEWLKMNSTGFLRYETR